MRNINYIKSKTKTILNILTSLKKKKKKKKPKYIQEVLQLPSMRFHILKSLHDIFIINPISYIFFSIYTAKQLFIH